MRRLTLVVLLFACKGGSTAPKGPVTDEISVHTSFATDDEVAPSYGKADLQRTLAEERAAVDKAQTRLAELADGGDYDVLRAFERDLAVRRRFVASLEVCAANGRICPPRLDDPPWTFNVESDADPALDAPLRFDRDSWQKVAAELNGRACACRTAACLDSVAVAIDRLETRPMPDVQSDDTASVSIVRARDCLYRLRGKRPTPRVYATE